MQIRFHCPHCDFPMRISKWETLDNFSCPNCNTPIENHIDEKARSENELDHCLICGNQNLFRQKLFNRNFGIAIVVAGVIISLFIRFKVIPLLVVAAIDVTLYLTLPFMIVCYNCDAEFRGFQSKKEFKHYDHLLAAKTKKQATYPGAEESH